MEKYRELQEHCFLNDECLSCARLYPKAFNDLTWVSAHLRSDQIYFNIVLTSRFQAVANDWNLPQTKAKKGVRGEKNYWQSLEVQEFGLWVDPKGSREVFRVPSLSASLNFFHAVKEDGYKTALGFHWLDSSQSQKRKHTFQWLQHKKSSLGTVSPKLPEVVLNPCKSWIPKPGLSEASLSPI